MDKPILTRSVRLALLGMGAMGAVLPLGAAESAGNTDDTELAEVVVTGTRVRGAAPVGSTVLTLDRDALEGAGQPTVDRIIKDLPLNFDLGVSENSRAQSGGAGNIVYGNTVNLRGIGPYATLVLVDGHRVTNNTRSTDPSIIPTLGLERVEVVADGASAIYGSDAVAGVVNLIPRRTLDGTEVFGRFGAATQGGFSEWVTGAAWGKVWDRGQFMLAYEHVDRQNLSGDDRDFFVADQTPFGGRDYRTTRCNPGTIVIGATTYAIPASGVTQATAAALTPGTANRCNELVGQDLFPRQKYDSVSTTFRFPPDNKEQLITEILVRSAGGGEGRYLLPLAPAWEDGPNWPLNGPLALARVRRGRRVGLLTDAVTTPAFVHALLDGLKQGLHLATAAGEIVFRPTEGLNALDIAPDAEVAWPGGEQSSGCGGVYQMRSPVSMSIACMPPVSSLR